MPRRKHEQNIDDELIKKAARLLKNEKLNKKQNEAYKRLKVNVNKRNQQWSIDLADLKELSGFNSQYRYILVRVLMFIYLFIYLLSFSKSSIVTLGIYVHFT